MVSKFPHFSNKIIRHFDPLGLFALFKFTVDKGRGGGSFYRGPGLRWGPRLYKRTKFTSFWVIFRYFGSWKVWSLLKLKSRAGRPTCGPEIFLCGPNWIQNLKKNRYFDHFSFGFWQKVAQIMGKSWSAAQRPTWVWCPWSRGGLFIRSFLA